MAIGDTWYDTLDTIGRARFTDLLVPARSGPTPGGFRAAALFGQVYLQMADGYLRLAAADDQAGLAVRQVAALGFEDHPRRGDDPASVFPVSLSSAFFGDLEAVECGTVNYVTNGQSDLSRGFVRCVELAISGNQRLFFAARGAAGIRIGHAGAFGAWLSESSHRRLPMERHTWTRPG